MSIKSFLVLLVAIAWTPIALADHPDDPPRGGGAMALYNASENLERTVRWSGISWRVVSAVNYFGSNVHRFYQCSRFGDGDLEPNEVVMDQPEERIVDQPDFEHPDEGNCRSQMNSVQGAWYQVDRYLYDTNWDYPQVYRAYMRVRRALNRVGRF